jgi:DNA invertase Pin-like site-specific DNA recombinase
MARKFGYARVSSDGQDLTAQRQALHAAGCDIIREEKVSGGSTSGREQLAILLDFIAEGDTLVVTRLDRLARSTLDMLMIITKLGERGVKFVSLAEPWANTDSPASKLMLTVMAGIAEFERGRIRERQREGIVVAKAKGVFKGGKVRFDPTIIQKKREEGMTPTQIARHLGCNPATVFRALRLTAAPLTALVGS